MTKTELNFKTLPAEKCLSRKLADTLECDPPTTTLVDSYSQTLCYGNTVDDKCSQTEEEFMLVHIRNLTFQVDTNTSLCKSFNLETQGFSSSSEQLLSLQTDSDMFTIERMEKECQTVISVK